MFARIVSQLSLTPQAAVQLSAYARQLRRQRSVRTLITIAAVALIALQVAVFAWPAQASNTASANDLVFGGAPSASQLLNIYNNGDGRPGQIAGQLQDIYNAFGITRTILAAASSGNVTVTGSPLWVVGREQQFGQSKALSIAGTTLYATPLRLWRGPGRYTNRPLSAFRGATATGQPFAILADSGDIVVAQLPPSLLVLPVPLTLKQTAINLTQLTAGRPSSATAVTAHAGDFIRYTLSATNQSSHTVSSYHMNLPIGDVLEYATLVQANGATLANDTLSWPATSIAPGKTLTRDLTVRLAAPIPPTAASTSDPASYNLSLQSVYGNALAIAIKAPGGKQLEAASHDLPPVGAGWDLAIILLLGLLALWSQARYRQLAREIGILRGDYIGGRP